MDNNELQNEPQSDKPAQQQMDTNKPQSEPQSNTPTPQQLNNEKQKNEPQSGKPTPQQINKEKQKQEAAAEGTKTRCKICFRETYPKRQCGGHGGGGGGGGPSGGGGNDASASSSVPEGKISSGVTPGPSSVPSELLEGSEGIDAGSESLISEKSFNPDVIAELLDTNLLAIDNDRELETLTIKLRCKPEDLTEEQKNEFTKFVNAIVKQLDEFKEENGISANCKIIERDDKGNILSLRIALPNTKLYDAFIQKLAANLLPVPTLNREQQVKADHRASINPLNPTPLSMKPTPSANKKVKLTDDEKQQNEELDLKTDDEEEKENIQEEPFNPSPFLTIPKPKD